MLDSSGFILLLGWGNEGQENFLDITLHYTIFRDDASGTAHNSKTTTQRWQLLTRLFLLDFLPFYTFQTIVIQYWPNPELNICIKPDSYYLTLPTPTAPPLSVPSSS